MKMKKLSNNLPKKPCFKGTTTFNVSRRNLSVGKKHSRKETKTTVTKKLEIIIKIENWQSSAAPQNAFPVFIDWSKAYFFLVNIMLPVLLSYSCN
jgi:hypothetical protein